MGYIRVMRQVFNHTMQQLGLAFTQGWESLACLIAEKISVLKYGEKTNGEINKKYGKTFYYLFYKSDTLFNISDMLYTI